MKDSETLVFVEMKYRESDLYGGDVGVITADKQRRLSIGA